VKTTVVIPTYNESHNLPKLVEALFALPLPELKLLIVDDGSPDGTGELAEKLATQHPGRLRVHHRTGKLGLGSAYITGFGLAIQDGAEAIGQMDADFSHPPEKLIELVEALADCDVAMGSRYIPGGAVDREWPLWRKGLSAFGNIYARTILGMRLHDVTGGFRLWRRRTLNAMPLERVKSNGYVFQVEMAYIAQRLGFNFLEVPFYFADRKLGESKMTLRIQLEAALRVWYLRYSYRDLKPLPHG
jgi:dolichol-phosphate mannosyltransferase